MVETIDEEEDVAPQARLPKTPHGAPNPDESPQDFTLKEPLKTDRPTIPNLPPEEMIGRTFLMPPQENGTRLCAKILERVRASHEELKANPDLIKFKCKLGDTELAEIVAYNDIVKYIKDDETWDGVWTFEEILAHEGPFRKGHPRHKNHPITFTSSGVQARNHGSPSRTSLNLILSPLLSMLDRITSLTLLVGVANS